MKNGGAHTTPAARATHGNRAARRAAQTPTCREAQVFPMRGQPLHAAPTRHPTVPQRAPQPTGRTAPRRASTGALQACCLPCTRRSSARAAAGPALREPLRATVAAVAAALPHAQTHEGHHGRPPAASSWPAAARSCCSRAVGGRDAALLRAADDAATRAVGGLKRSQTRHAAVSRRTRCRWLPLQQGTARGGSNRPSSTARPWRGRRRRSRCPQTPENATTRWLTAQRRPGQAALAPGLPWLLMGGASAQ